MTSLITDGAGPGLVLVHGAGTDPDSYSALSGALSRRFTVIRYRRPASGPGPTAPAKVMRREVDALARVLERTGATRVFGHSYGGLVALRAALSPELDLTRVATFDAAASVDGDYPTAFLAPMRAAVADGRREEAMRLLGAGLGTMPSLPVPAPAQRALMRLIALTPPGQPLARTIADVLVDCESVAGLGSGAEAYRGIGARTLLLSGDRSPDYFRSAATALAGAIPGASAATLRGGHGLPCGRADAERLADHMA